ncbi:hypothetical protein CL617_01370 [archaeon]|nr:hypothetical protein [archaeon]|tara:strand:- start:4491 stop:5051 length:561 start_codon:yes stop_codon:yes gene_type:complete
MVKVKAKKSSKKDINRIIHKNILDRFNHLKELLKDIKDKEVKKEVKKDIEIIKEEVRTNDLFNLDVGLIEETLAKVENSVDVIDDYNPQINETRRDNSILENTIQELAKDIPKDQNKGIKYSASRSDYGGEYTGSYESVKYGSNSLKKDQDRRTNEFNIVEETMEFGKYDSNSKDIYSTEKKQKKV